MLAAGQKRKLEAVDAVITEDEEEKKRRKKEAAQAFFAEAKKKKDAAKLEREAAIARGEAVPAKEAPPPLKEPPVLAPQVRALTAAVTDPSVSYDSLYALYQRVVSVRHEIANASAELANREDATMQQRRKALLRVVVDRLRCVDDQTLPLSCVAADPAVAVLRKGLAKSLVNFASGYPDCLKVSEHVNAKGHSIQYLTLEGSGPKGTGAEAVETNVGAEMLLSQILVTMQGCGGVAPVGGLTGDVMIKERMKGVTSKLSKFLAHYPDIFQLGQGPNDREMMCYLKDAVPVTAPAVADQGQFGQFSYTAGGPQAQQGLDQWGAMNAAGTQQGLSQWGAQTGLNDGLGAPDPREQLVQMIVSFLQAKGGVATMSELGMEPTLKAAQKGVVAKLSKFLGQHPYFSVQAEGPQQMMTCRLVGM